MKKDVDDWCNQVHCMQNNGNTDAAHFSHFHSNLREFLFHNTRSRVSKIARLQSTLEPLYSVCGEEIMHRLNQFTIQHDEADVYLHQAYPAVSRKWQSVGHAMFNLADHFTQSLNLLLLRQVVSTAIQIEAEKILPNVVLDTILALSQNSHIVRFLNVHMESAATFMLKAFATYTEVMHEVVMSKIKSPPYVGEFMCARHVLQIIRNNPTLPDDVHSSALVYANGRAS